MTQAADQILLAPPQKPPWEQDLSLRWVPRAKRELKSEVSKSSVDIMGFLGSDAETKSTRDGVPVTVLSLATKRSWPVREKTTQGEWQSHTDWHRTCFGAVAEFAASLRKGAHLHVTGYLRSREVEKPVPGAGQKSTARVKFTAWEVRAIRIAKLDRAVEANPSTDIPADYPAV